MRPIDPAQFAKAPTAGGSARVSEAVARVIRSRSGVKTPAAPRDPAPSRAAYRMNRLWLTPSFRFGMRRVAPVLAVLGCIGLYFSAEDNRRQVTDIYGEIKREVQNRPEFMVKLMAIDGASDDVSQDIRDVASVDFPLSSFDLDLHGMLNRIESLDAVSEVGLRVRSGGILQVDITERVPAVVWRSHNGLEMLDAGGLRVAALQTRLDRPDLPLIVGESADRHVDEALALIASAPSIITRMRGIVRIGERRWNVVLDREQTILLPETNPLVALSQVIALDQAKDILARDIRVIDMRNPARPTLQLSADALDELARVRGIEIGVSY